MLALLSLIVSATPVSTSTMNVRVVIPPSGGWKVSVLRTTTVGARAPEGLMFPGKARVTVRREGAVLPRPRPTNFFGFTGTGPLEKGDVVRSEVEEVVEPTHDVGEFGTIPLEGAGEVRVEWPQAMQCAVAINGLASPSRLASGKRRVVERFADQGGRRLEVSCGVTWPAIVTASRAPVSLSEPMTVSLDALKAQREPERIDAVLDLFAKSSSEDSKELEERAMASRLAVMLRRSAIDAVVARLGPQEAPIRRSFPRAADEDRFFVVVRSGEGVWWLEPSADPGAACLAAFEGQDALLVDEGLAFLTVPAAEPATVTLNSTVTFPAAGDLGRVEEDWSTSRCAPGRVFSRSWRLLGAQPPTAPAPPRAHRMSALSRVTFSTEESAADRHGDWDGVVTLGELRRLLPHPDSLSPRAPREVLQPVRARQVIHLTLPPHFVLTPVQVEVEGPGFSFKRHSSQQAEVVEIVETLQVTASALKREDFEAYRTALERLAAPALAYTTMSHELRAAIDRRQWRAAGLIAQRHGPLERSELARHFRLRREAIRFAREAVALAPASARARRALTAALALEDPFEPGDDVERLKEARHAFELEPASAAARFDYANALLGGRSGPVSDTAVSEALKLALRPPVLTSLQEHVGELLLAAGRPRDVLVLDCTSARCARHATLASLALGAVTGASSEELDEALRLRLYQVLASAPEADLTETAKRRRFLARHEARTFEPTSPTEVAAEVLAHRMGAKRRVDLAVPSRPGLTGMDSFLDELVVAPAEVIEVEENVRLVRLGRANQQVAVMLEKSGTSYRLHPDIGTVRLAGRVLDALERKDLVRARAWVDAWHGYECNYAVKVDEDTNVLWGAFELFRVLPPPRARERLATLPTTLGLTDPVLLRELGMTHVALGSPEDALRVVKPIDAAAVEVRVMALLKLGRIDEAEREVQAWLANEPKDPSRTALLYLPAAARREFAKVRAMRVDGDDSAAARGGAAWWAVVGDLVDEAAVLDGRAAVAAFPKDYGALVNGVLIEAMAGNLMEAEALLGRLASTLAPRQSPEPELMLAQALMADALGFSEDAAKRYEAVTGPVPTAQAAEDLRPLARRRLEALRTKKQGVPTR
jgi:hypothetical protein